MIVLRDKEFGKYDKQLAARDGISVEELRQFRAGYKGTGTVNDAINLRGMGPIDKGSINIHGTNISNNNSKGLVSDINSRRLDTYKRMKEKFSDLNPKNSKKLAYITTLSNDSGSIVRNSNTLSKDIKATQENAVNRSPKHTKNVTQQAQQQAKQADSISNNMKTEHFTGQKGNLFTKGSKPGFGKTAMEFAKKNKAAIGIGAGLGVAVGGYEMYKNKKKENKK